MSAAFRFKQFVVHHDQCAMKVGTDGVLLGAYADVSEAKHILDIGTGSGVIALMLAQRCPALIDGIEPHRDSANQAKHNASSSPWKDRITIYHTSLQDYSLQHPDQYDTIICNPPFFADQLRSPDQNRNQVRHDVTLNFPDLVAGVKRLMKSRGMFWLIIPVTESERLLAFAKESKLYLHHELTVHPKAGKAAHRMIMALENDRTESIVRSTISIRNSNDSYSSNYKELTSDFYLDF